MQSAVPLFPLHFWSDDEGELHSSFVAGCVLLVSERLLQRPRPVVRHRPLGQRSRDLCHVRPAVRSCGSSVINNRRFPNFPRRSDINRCTSVSERARWSRSGRQDLGVESSSYTPLPTTETYTVTHGRWIVLDGRPTEWVARHEVHRAGYSTKKFTCWIVKLLSLSRLQLIALHRVSIESMAVGAPLASHPPIPLSGVQPLQSTIVLSLGGPSDPSSGRSIDLCGGSHARWLADRSMWWSRRLLHLLAAYRMVAILSDAHDGRRCRRRCMMAVSYRLRDCGVDERTESASCYANAREISGRHRAGWSNDLTPSLSWLPTTTTQCRWIMLSLCWFFSRPIRSNLSVRPLYIYIDGQQLGRHDTGPDQWMNERSWVPACSDVRVVFVYYCLVQVSHHSGRVVVHGVIKSSQRSLSWQVCKRTQHPFPICRFSPASLEVTGSRPSFDDVSDINFSNRHGLQHRGINSGLCGIARIIMSADRMSDFHPKIAFRIAIKLQSSLSLLFYVSRILIYSQTGWHKLNLVVRWLYRKGQHSSCNEVT